MEKIANTGIGFDSLINYKCFVDDGVIFHDDLNFVFQKTFRINGFDFEGADDHEVEGISKYLNLVFAGIPTGWVISMNNIRVKDNNYLDAGKNHYEASSLLKFLDKERE
jgi:type IV secretory pathway VirB4 component